MTPTDQRNVGTGTGPTHLYLINDLEDIASQEIVEDGDLAALRSVAAWIEGFVTMPHRDLGRVGAVCPFVPGGLERKTIWLAPERIADRSVPAVAELIKTYKKLLCDAQPTRGDGLNYKAILVVFPDLPPEHAKSFFNDLLKHVAVPSYAEDGVVLGPFYQTNEATAIYNHSFRPFTPPVPFLLMRHAVLSDWKFFLDDDSWRELWARRYGESGALALADELRGLSWREKHA